jgi:alkylation response protein AidB-like acyl-CoA dehydrogenase
VELQLTDDQQLFVETSRRYLDAESPLTRVRELHEDATGFDPDFWQRGAELGWTGLLVPEDQGGGSVSGNGLLDLALVAEEIGRRVAPGPLLPVNVVASALAEAGSELHRTEVLPGLLGGTVVATWALAESGDAWDASGVRLRATSSQDGWTLSGTKAFVQDVGASEWILVTARTGDALTQLLVPRAAPGLSITPLVSLDMVRRFGNLHFNDVVVPPSAVVGAPGGAGGDVERQLQTALVLQNAESVGAVDRVVQFTLEYAMDRVSFGRPIGSYQAIKHRLADAKMYLEACHGTASAAARAVQDRAPNASELVSVAKAYIADRGPAIIQDCVQIHGGIGVTWEADLHLYLRRVAQNAALYGSVAQHRERLAVMLDL